MITISTIIIITIIIVIIIIMIAIIRGPEPARRLPRAAPAGAAKGGVRRAGAGSV